MCIGMLFLKVLSGMGLEWLVELAMPKHWVQGESSCAFWAQIWEVRGNKLGLLHKEAAANCQNDSHYPPRDETFEKSEERMKEILACPFRQDHFCGYRICKVGKSTLMAWILSFSISSIYPTGELHLIKPLQAENCVCSPLTNKCGIEICNSAQR